MKHINTDSTHRSRVIVHRIVAAVTSSTRTTHQTVHYSYCHLDHVIEIDIIQIQLTCSFLPQLYRVVVIHFSQTREVNIYWKLHINIIR